jgi:DNA-directed RNA polymerase specialized sigma subunit
MDDLKLLEHERKKRYLKRYKKNGILIDRLENKLRALEVRIQGVKSPSLSGMPRGGEPVTREDLIADKVDLERRIERLKGKGEDMRREILDLIDELEDARYAEVLESFLIDDMTFKEIAEDMDYTERHVIRLYSEAIDAIALNSQ